MFEFEFEELPDATIRPRNFAVFKNGELLMDGIGGLTFDVQNLSKDLANWEIVLPSISGVRFLRLIHTAGYTVTAVTNNKPIYVAIGNSITHGVGQSDNGGHLTYPFLIADSLGYQVYNLGIGGSKVNERVIDNLSALPRSPELISVLWGYNDCMFPNDYLSLAVAKLDILIEDLASTYPDATIVPILQTFTHSDLGNNPINSISRLISETETVVDNLQSSYSNICKVNGWDYTDAGSVIDAVHLGDPGAESLAHGIISDLTVCGLFTSTESVFENEIQIKRSGTIIQVGSNKEVELLELYDLSGKLIKVYNKFEVDLQLFSSGNYILRAVFTDGFSSNTIVTK